MGGLSRGFALFLALIFAASLALPLHVVVKASPKTITVPDDYSSIQQAVDSAADGDTVFVRSGTYYQNVTINKQLSLIGEGREKTIIMAPPRGPASERDTSERYLFDPTMTIIINATNVRISGFTVRNEEGFHDLDDYSDGTQIISNTLTNLLVQGSNCVIANNTSISRLVCEGSNNSISGNSCGTIVLEGSSNLLNENSVDAIELRRADSNTVSNNDNCSSIDVTGSSNNLFGNIIKSTGYRAIWVYGHGNVFSRNNITHTGESLGIISQTLNSFFHNNFFISPQSAGAWFPARLARVPEVFCSTPRQSSGSRRARKAADR